MSLRRSTHKAHDENSLHQPVAVSPYTHRAELDEINQKQAEMYATMCEHHARMARFHRDQASFFAGKDPELAEASLARAHRSENKLKQLTESARPAGETASFHAPADEAASFHAATLKNLKKKLNRSAVPP